MYTCFLVYYSPSPSLMYCIRCSSASLSSSPLQISSISSPDFMHAPSTESTLFALATFFSSYINVTFDLNFIASLQRLPAGRKCNPVGFLIIIFCATTFITSFRLYIYQCDELSEPLFPVFPDDVLPDDVPADDEPPVPVSPDVVPPVVEPEAVPVPSVPVVPPPSPFLPITI